MSCSESLIYNSLSLVYLQIFTYEEFDNTLLDKAQFTPIPNSIDKQIFELNDGSKSPVERYRLKPFTFELSLNDKQKIEGEIFVEMSLFFNRTVSLTYRMVINEASCKKMNALRAESGEDKELEKYICKSTTALSTDDLIALSALRVGAEHWNCDEDGPEYETASNINIKLSKLHIDNFYLDEDGELRTPGIEANKESLYLEEIQRRYKKFIFNTQRCAQRQKERSRSFKVLYPKIDLTTYEGDCTKDLNYVYIDVWEDISSSGNEFKGKREEDIVSHIYENHQRELIGLMSFYPYEWPYRAKESFGDVCGTNVAIDTDDLILLNQNICVVFGTYGLRGKNAATDWEKHLEERKHYHVSWPEYLLILEMILAKKYTMIAVSDLYLDKALNIPSVKKIRRLIEDNALYSLKVTTILLRLDAVKYSRYISHIIMYEKSAQRLGLEKEAERLNDIMDKTDKSLLNISDMRRLQYSSQLNILLGVISAASLLAFLFNKLEVPFMEALGFKESTDETGFALILFAILLLLVFVVKVTIMNIKNNRLR